tara:strand:+ start:1620 stop:4937 length:3318 start_codon:yes stop_codon:yes gene_type:complete
MKKKKNFYSKIFIQRIMKIYLVLLTITVLKAFGSNTFAQNISIKADNIKLKKILSEIEVKSGYNFFYNTSLIDVNTKVSINIEGLKIREALDFLLKGKRIDFSFINDMIIFYPEGNTEFIKKMKKSLFVGNDEINTTALSYNSLNPKRINNIINAAVNLQTKITGLIVDENGLPIPGVEVVVKGTNIGTVADMNGRFELKSNSDVVLIFNMMGYKEKEVSVKEINDITVVLNEESTQLEGVVVVGYNTVEKKHIASSIVEMDMDLAKSRPIAKLEEAFSGTIPGVTLMQGSNLPGSVPGTISIRGISTLQNADPLVIIDGMEQSLTDVDPNQVKSISVLKDAASASMYGSRGANGVIIIETERGSTGNFKVDLHTWAAIQDPLDLPDFVNSENYMLLNNEANQMQGQPLLYTEEDIAAARRGEIANTNWLDAIMQRKAHSYNTSVSVSGGGGVGTFNLMMGYISENGLNSSEGTDKFSARFNTNINIDDKFVLLADFYAHRLEVDRLMSNTDGHGLYSNAWRMNPTQNVYYTSDLDEHYVLYDNLNPVASMFRGGETKNLHDRSTINLRPKYYINDNLHIAGNVSYMINKSASKYERSTFKFYDGDSKPVTTWGNSVGSSQGVSVSQITARANVNYEKSLRKEKDKIYFVAGTEIMNNTYTDYREVSKSSFFSKLNYSFDNRYLLELTARADGSSKFAPNNRWGYFPSAAVAWNVHNEGFMSDLKESGAISELKFRISYGKIGNENVNPYLWEEVVNTWGWTMRVPNPNFSWEKQTQKNLAVDLSLLNDKLSLTAEIYEKHSLDLIYSSFPVPPLTGSYYLETSVNIGEVENKGWEVSANWRDKKGDFSYNIGASLFNNENKVLKAGYSESDTLIFKNNNDKIWYKGIAIDNYYGYKSNGYFKDQAEVDGTDAKLPNTIPGDIKYIDQNGDGVINDKDKVDLGDPFPHLNYSLTFNFKYKNWDVSMLGQGVGRRTGRLNGLEGYPVIMDGSSNSLGTPRQYYMDNRWTPSTPNSRFPRVWTGSSSNAVLSDVWLSDASFFRIKTMQLGYTIPRIGKGIKNCRIYYNAQDVFTSTKWEGLEPERNGGNGNYPRSASYSLGIKATIL